MPRQEPLNDRIVEALENRKRKCEILKMGKQFTYKAAIDKIKAMRTNITRASHVLNLKDVPPTMKEEIVNIINGTAPVEVAPPTPGELRKAERRGTNQMFQHPPAKGSGGWCILLALHNAHNNGRATLTKDQIIRWAGSHLHIALEDGAAGYSKWSNVTNMETKCWLHRTAYSRMFGGGGTSGFGGRKDEFELTEEGSMLAAILWEQHFGAGGGPTGTSAATAAGRQQRRHSASPAGFAAPGTAGTAATARAAAASGFDAFLDQLTTGPEFISHHGGGAAAAAAAGRYSAGVSPFTGRGHVLGGGRDSRAGAAAGAAGLGSSRRLDFEGDEMSEGDADQGMEVDEEGFPVYRPELFGEDPATAAAPHRDAATPAAAAAAGAGGRGRGRGTASSSRGRGRAAAAAATRPGPAGGAAAAAARAAVLDGLIPRVTKQQWLVPLCDASAQCTSCASLQGFIENERALELPMVLSKKGLAHVQQTVGWLMAPQGGSWALQMDVAADKKSVTICKLHDAAAGDGSRPKQATAAAPGAPAHNPLAALESLLGSRPSTQQQQPPPLQQQRQPASPAVRPSVRPTATPAAPAAAAAAAATSRQHGSACPLSPAQKAAIAAEARMAEQRLRQQQQKQQHDTPAAAKQTEQICLLDATLPDDADADFDLLLQQQQPHHHQQQRKRAADWGVVLDSEDDEAEEFRQGRGAAAAAGARRGSPAAADPAFVSLLESQDAAAAAWEVEEAAAAAAAGALQHKRRQQQQQHSNSTANASDADEDSVEASIRQAAKRRRTQQQQKQPMCIELLESQDVAGGIGFGLGLELGLDSKLDGTGAAAAATREGNRRPRGTYATDGSTPASGGARTDSRQAADAATAAAAAAGVLGSSSPEFELKLVVDDKERRSEDDYHRIYSNIWQEHMRLQQLPSGTTLDVDRDKLPLGDYMWLMLPAGAAPSAADAAAADSEDGEAEERAAAAERAACVLTGAVVERKTMRDLVGRSAAGDHVRQLQRMYQLRELVPLQLLLIENLTHMAGRYTVYQPGPGSTTSACTVDSETSLFDFVVRAAVSHYGSTQRILLTPTEGDSRGVLLAMSQLLLHEMRQLQINQQQQRRQQGSLSQQQQQQQHHKLLAATQTSYPEFASLCQQVNQRLPRSQLPVELLGYAQVSPVSPDVAFSVTKGAAKSEFAGLVLYSHNSYTQLQIVSIEGHNLLKLLNGFYTEAVVARRRTTGGTAAAAGAAAADTVGLAMSEAVEVAQEVATLLTSLLEGFMADVGMSSSSSGSQASGSQGDLQQQQQQQRPPCRMLMVRDLLGAVMYMGKVHQRAAVNTGSKAATKKAAERQAEACVFDAEGIRQGMWLWLLCFLQHGWHLQLCPTARATEILLEVAGSRCCWLAEQLRHEVGQQQQHQQQGGEQRHQMREQQQPQDVRPGLPGGCQRQEPLQEAEVTGAGVDAKRCAASPAPDRQQQEKLQQQQKPQQQPKPVTQCGSSFMDWLDDFVVKECGADKEQQQELQQQPQKQHPAAAGSTAAAAGAARGTKPVAGSSGAQQGRAGGEVIVLETQPDDDDEVIVLE